jgi:hypothetical protein
MGLGRGALLWLLGIPLPINFAGSFLALKVWPNWQVRCGRLLAVLRSNRRRYKSLTPDIAGDSSPGRTPRSCR